MIDLEFARRALGRCILFAGLEPGQIDVVATGLRTRRFRRGEVLFHQGDPGDSLFVIAAGSVKVVLPSESGDEAILSTLRPGGFLGELALLDGAPRSATVVALERTETLILPRARFRALVAAEPALRDALLAGLAGELRRLTEHVGELHFLDLTGRLAASLARLAHEHGVLQPDGSLRLDARLTQADLAAMVGSTRQSVNKLLGTFAEDGLIQLDRDALVVARLDDLERMAGQ